MKSEPDSDRKESDKNRVGSDRPSMTWVNLMHEQIANSKHFEHFPNIKIFSYYIELKKKHYLLDF